MPVDLANRRLMPRSRSEGSTVVSPQRFSDASGRRTSLGIRHTSLGRKFLPNAFSLRRHRESLSFRSYGNCDDDNDDIDENDQGVFKQIHIKLKSTFDLKGGEHEETHHNERKKNAHNVNYSSARHEQRRSSH